jgi:hypothetical protein
LLLDKDDHLLDVVTVASGKPRPAVVVQSDHLLPYPMVIVVPFTSVAGRLSTGANCTCILPIVLLERTGPLFIDQPEDSLDGGYVYDVLVQTLRRVKANRQTLRDPRLGFVVRAPVMPET